MDTNEIHMFPPSDYDDRRCPGSPPPSGTPYNLVGDAWLNHNLLIRSRPWKRRQQSLFRGSPSRRTNAAPRLRRAQYTLSIGWGLTTAQKEAIGYAKAYQAQRHTGVARRFPDQADEAWRLGASTKRTRKDGSLVDVWLKGCRWSWVGRKSKSSSSTVTSASSHRPAARPRSPTGPRAPSWPT